MFLDIKTYALTMQGSDNAPPTRRELAQYVRNQGILLVCVTTGLVVVTLALVRKGVISWPDLTGRVTSHG